MKIKFKPLSDNFKLPVYSSDEAACFDVFAVNDFTVKAGSFTEISLGFSAEIQQGYCVKIYPRSGFGCKRGIGIRNTVGIIDSDYRGEWKAFVTADTFGLVGEYKFKAGAKILQCSIDKVNHAELVIDCELSDTKRGSGGFGSTGE